MAGPSEPGSCGEGYSCPGTNPAREFVKCEGSGSGVLEFKIDFGPGYRIYFGKDGELLVILLGGGTKKHQQQDIALGLARWQDYKQRKGTKKERDR